MQKHFQFLLIALLLVFPVFIGAKTLWTRAAGFIAFAPKATYLFENTQGPSEHTTVPEPSPALWQTYNQGGSSRLAILLTQPQSNWLGLAHGLKSIGVPFTITDDYTQALQHKVVLVYPMVSGNVLSSNALRALRKFVADGGTLIAQNVLGGGINDLFGFEGAEEKIHSHNVLFNTQSPYTDFLTDPYEKETRIASGEDIVEGVIGYKNPIVKPLAVYENGLAAITQNAAGTAFAIGPDLGYFLLKGYNNRQENIARHYVNDYEPTLDVFLRLLKRIYTINNEDAVTLATAPNGKKLSVLLTHDIDYTRSTINAVEYARFEKEHGVTATYFMQTKYVRDWNDDVFFTQENLPYLKQLQQLGMEIASHTVCHSRSYSHFPLGDGNEQYPSYVPYVRSQYDTINGTVLGELRVSRFLLEHFVPDLTVTSFRPGHLSNPYALPQALQATGYSYSSSVTAGDSLTHLPFRLNYGRENTAETSIYEIPLTVEDEANGPMINRLPDAIRLAETLKRYGAVFVILIHPDIVGQKFAFEKGFVAAMDSSVWYASMRQFGDWWSARDQVGVDVVKNGNLITLSLTAPKPVSGLTLSHPQNWKLEPPTPSLSVNDSDGQTIIKDLVGQVTLVFRTTEAGHSRDTQPPL